MNRFNLTFSGEIIAGKDPERTKRRFGELFGIDDPVRLERYFSGETIILHGDLDRKTAAEYFSKLQQLGVVAQLVKVSDDPVPTEPDKTTATTGRSRPTKAAPVNDSPRDDQAEKVTTPSSGQAGQRWAVSASKRSPPRTATDSASDNIAQGETARQKATREKAKRKASASASRKAREAADRKARREEAARKKAEQEEAKRLAEEEKRRKAEEAARKKAEREEAQRRAAEEKRRKAEEAARIKAEREEAQRRAAEEKRKKAEEAARIEEAQRRAAEEKRKKAEEAARIKAEREEAKRLAEEEKRRKAAEAARIKAEREEAQRRAAEETARREAERAEQERREAEQEAARQKALEEIAVQRAARELTRHPSLKPVDARVRTRLDVPQKNNRRDRDATGVTARGRRQPGSPNYYSLRAFRNTQDIRTRATRSRIAARRGFVIAALALACLFILGGRYLGRSAPPLITGASAMAVAPGSGPALLAAGRLLLHDRAGVGSNSIPLAELGIAELAGAMSFNAAGELLAMAKTAPGGGPDAGVEEAGLSLQRCNLQEKRCHTFSSALAGVEIAAFAENPLTGSLFLADLDNGRLIKAAADGTVQAGVQLSLPPHPVVRLESGLLFINSAAGPAISVLRYDDNALGQQLDEILLLPPPALAAEQSRVWDFARLADSWWVALYNPETNSAGVYRFNEQWNYIDQVALAPGSWPQQLAVWGEKLLIRDAGQPAIQRFNALGKPEVPVLSDLLQDLVLERDRSRRLNGLAWRGALALLGLIAVVGMCLGYLHRIRGLVYRSHRERGAEPMEDVIDAVQWVAPAPDRGAQMLRTATAYTALALVILSVAITFGVSVMQLSALLLALVGPAIALVLFNRSPIGHIGILGKQLFLADHSGMYHLGSDARLQCRGRFLLIDDVVVFSGSRLLPAFAPDQIKRQVTPLTRAAIKVDRKTVAVKLLQSRHPLARGATVTTLGLLLATALLALQQ